MRIHVCEQLVTIATFFQTSCIAITGAMTRRWCLSTRYTFWGNTAHKLMTKNRIGFDKYFRLLLLKMFANCICSVRTDVRVNKNRILILCEIPLFVVTELSRVKL